MTTVEEKLAKSLTAESTALIPYLPYLLQDLWELGSSPKDMATLIYNHVNVSIDTKVLDLACGKGAVGISLAKKFGCRVKGIDLMPDFIEEARKKAIEHQVENLCDFSIGDINHSVEIERDYDIVVLGAVGQVLGSQEETLKKLSQTIKKNGYLLLDDGYAKSESEKAYLTKIQWPEIIAESGFQLIADLPIEQSDLSDVIEEQMACLTKRTNELKKRYPEDAHLFDQYLKSQLVECEELENDIIGVTMLLRKRLTSTGFLGSGGV